uniref:Uncharacterized protein n=1 Tax=Avena sativa TaxID=4498 RepID=A0ACD5WI24_AVESA
MASRRRRPSSPSPGPAPPLEDEDLLGEILLRLPVQPPHLLNASLVSERWRRVATDRRFVRRFRIHHGRPPLLGLFRGYSGGYRIDVASFRSAPGSPYRVPSGRFYLPSDGRQGWRLVDCRHGRLLFEHWEQHEAIIWDPITEDHCFVSVPLQFRHPKILSYNWAVLCAADEQGHVHGCCHWSPFKIVLVASYRRENQAAAIIASVYSSATGTWGDLLSTSVPYVSTSITPHSTLVGNTLHWSHVRGFRVIQFDLDAQRLALVEMVRPPGVPYNVHIIHSEDGGVAFATLSNLHEEPHFQMWERKVSCDGVPTWVLLKSVELKQILGLGFWISKEESCIVSYAEDVRAIFLRVHLCVYMIQLESMQSKELFIEGDPLSTYHPFTSFSTEGF